MEGGADFILFETQPNRAAIGTLRRRHAQPARRALRALLRRAVGRARRPPANRSSGCWPRCPPIVPQPIAWGMNCGSRARRPARRGRAGRAADDAAADRAAQRRHAQGGREPPHLPLLARVSGRVRQALRGPGRVGRRRLLRHHARAHPRGGRWRSSRWPGRRSKPAVVAPARAVEPKPPPPLAEKSQLGRRLAARQWVTTVELLPPRGYDLRSTDREEPSTLHERGVTRSTFPTAPGPVARHLAADHRRAHPARGRDRADPALLLPRPEPDRHAGRPAGLRGLRHPQHPVRDRRPAQAGRLSARHRRVRRRFDRHGGRAAAAQLRHRPGRPGHRPAHLRRDRRGARSDGARPHSASWTVSARRSRPAPSSPSRSRSSIPTPCCDSSTRCSATAFRSSPASGRWRAIATRRSCGTRCRAWSCPTRSWSGWPRSRAARTSWPMGIEIARESVARVRDRVAGIQVSARSARSKRRWR